MDLAGRAGARAVIWTIVWLLLSLLLREGGSDASKGQSR